MDYDKHRQEIRKTIQGGDEQLKKMYHIGLGLDSALSKMIEQEKKEGRSYTEIFRSALREWFENHGKKAGIETINNLKE